MHIDGKQMHRVHIGGRLNFDSFPKEVQHAIKVRLAERDPMMKGSLSRGALPGIKIDGKVVTRENIKDFEIKAMKSETVSKKSEVKKKFSKDKLQAMSLKELKKVGDALGTTDKSRSKLIKEILNLQ